MNEQLEDTDSALEETDMVGIRSDLAELVLSLTHDLLERTDVTLDDDFFSAGGDSIIAMHLVGQLARQTGLRLRVSIIFANPNLGEFAAAVEQLRQTAVADTPDRETPLARALEAARLAPVDGDHAA